MSLSHKLLAGFALATGCAITAHAGSITLNVRPGLWEMTTSGETSGTVPIPADVLAWLPPDRRAKVEAAMAANQSHAAKPHVYKECVTQASLQHGFNLDEERGHHCQNTVVTANSSTMDVKMQCKETNGTVSGTIHFTAATPEVVNGTVSMSMTDGVHTFNVNRVMNAKWLGADCGNVKPSGE